MGSCGIQRDNVRRASDFGSWLTVLMLVSGCAGERAGSGGETRITIREDGVTCIVDDEPVRCDGVDTHLRDELRAPAERLIVLFPEGEQAEARTRRVMDAIARAGYGKVLVVGFVNEPVRPETSTGATALTPASFTFIGPGTTMEQVRATVGAPDRDIGSGIHIYLYALPDGSHVWIGSPDASEILYVRHVASGTSTSLYESTSR